MAIENAGKELALPLPDVRPVSQRPATFLSNVDTLLSALWGVKEFKQYLDHLTNAKSIHKRQVRHRPRLRGDGTASRKKATPRPKCWMWQAPRSTKIMRAIETLLRRDDMGRKQRLRQIEAAAHQAAQAAE